MNAIITMFEFSAEVVSEWGHTVPIVRLVTAEYGYEWAVDDFLGYVDWCAGDNRKVKALHVMEVPALVV